MKRTDRALAFVALASLAPLVTPQDAPVVAGGAVAFTTLVNFNNTDGANPYRGSLTQGADRNLYGTTSAAAPTA